MFTKKSLAGLAVVGIAAASSVAIMPSAFAAPGNIDPNATGSVTIVKLEQPDTAGAPASGRAQDVSGMTKLGGAKFKIQRVTAVGGVDVTAANLNNSAAWDAISNATVATAAVGDQVGEGTTAAGSGELQFSNLPVGLYLVTETEAPAGATLSDPFLVALPFTDDQGTPANTADDVWSYNVTVYPKNSVSGVAKTLNAASDAAAYKTGDEIVWQVTGSLPASTATNRLTTASYTDTLDSRLTYVRVENVKYAGTALTANDYTVSNTGQQVTVTMSATWLAADHVKGDLTFDLVTTVNATHATLSTGVIENEVSQTIVTNGGTPVITTSEKTASNWGELVLAKQDKRNKARLDGAEFQLFATKDDAEKNQNPITVDGKTTFTTGQVDLNGNGTIEDGEYGVLRVSALNIGTNGSRTYWLKETKAPAGYQLPEKPVYEVTVTPGAKTVVDITIDNTRNADLLLPITGAEGTAALMGLAAVIAAGGAVVLVRTKRRENAEIA